MISCSVKHPKIPPLKGILLVLAMLAVIAVAVFVIGFIAYVANVKAITWVAYVGLIIGATFFVKSKLQDYTYTISEGIFHIDRSTGTNVKNLIKFRVRDIVWFGNCDELPEEYKNINIRKMTFKHPEESQIIIYETPALCGARVTVTQEFASELKRRVLKNKKCEKNADDQKCEGNNANTL